MAEWLLEQQSAARERIEETLCFGTSDGDFQAQLRRSIKLLHSMLKLFSLEEIALTFNGGKDACVVFHLVRAAIAEMISVGCDGQAVPEAEVAKSLRRMKVLYFEPRKEFPEVTDFMTQVASRYGFEYTTYTCGYKDGMADLVANHGVKAVVMGMRRGDPYTEESERLEPSSDGWPPFLRVYPILDWDYGSVWTFLRGYGLEYCVLYDHGYTSLGDFDKTVQNTALLCPETGAYLPAYQLADYSLERVNRKTNHNSGSAPQTAASHKHEVTVLCLGDHSLASTQRDTRPIAFSRHLRELGCMVPQVILAIEPGRLGKTLRSITEGALLILTTDDHSASAAMEAVDSVCNAGPPAADGPTGQPSPRDREVKDVAMGVAAAPPSPSSTCGSSGKLAWESFTHYKKLRDTIVLLPSVGTLTGSQQKALLDSILTRLSKDQRHGDSSALSRAL